MNKFLIGCAMGALATSGAHAQSTGSNELEGTADAIVVTGSRVSSGVAGVIIPDVPKTRSILTQEFLNKQGAGNTVFNALNQIPGVNFTNTDPYGASGGNLRIRGFPGNRIAALFDGLPLNDTGNYSVYTNQQLDPEIIDQVSVNLGTTDVDSPTPSAAGGVVSYHTRLPNEEAGFLADASVGKFDFTRIFGMFDTGNITSGGLRAFVAVSDQRYDKFTGKAGELHRTQYNARIYQPLGTNGDFLSLAGHYNRNRNASYNNGLASDFARDKYFDNDSFCSRDLATPGVTDNDNGPATAAVTVPGLATSACTNFAGLRINPSNTGNIRGASRFTLADGLVLTVDPGYQYTLANGGGTFAFAERPTATERRLGTVDLNGDGDTLDTVRLYQPSNTRTHRYTVLSSLIYELNDSNRVRLAYTFDRGEHRQTGEFGLLDDSGRPFSVFGGKNDEMSRIITAEGNTFQNRDRESVALLNQVSAEYFGRFLEDRVTVQLGLRAPFFERQLNQFCYTSVSNGNPTCGSINALPTGAVIVPADYTRPATGAPANPFYAPFERTIKYSPLLPSAGVSFNIAGPHSVYASYGKNFSAPSTDNLYRSLAVDPIGEKTDAYELGYRFRASRVQAQLAGYYTDYQNRIVSASDADPASPTFGTSIDRNVGNARAYGFDAQLAWQPTSALSVTPFVSYINTKIKDDIILPPTTAGVDQSILTGGAEFVETPNWQFGGRADVDLGVVIFGAQYKYVGKRWSTDDNGRTLAAASTGGQTAGQAFVLQGIGNVPISGDGQTDAYQVVDVNARVSLAPLGAERTYLEFRVDNVFNEYYLGNISSQSTLLGSPRYRIGAPRTWQTTLRVAF